MDSQSCGKRNAFELDFACENVFEDDFVSLRVKYDCAKLIKLSCIEQLLQCLKELSACATIIVLSVRLFQIGIFHKYILMYFQKCKCYQVVQNGNHKKPR